MSLANVAPAERPTPARRRINADAAEGFSGATEPSREAARRRSAVRETPRRERLRLIATVGLASNQRMPNSYSGTATWFVEDSCATATGPRKAADPWFPGAGASGQLAR